MKLAEIFLKIKNFLKETQLEAKKVVWPERRYVMVASLIVLAITLIVGILVSAIDMAFARIITYFMHAF
jgi:preprotein translocase subunit SecE